MKSNGRVWVGIYAVAFLVFFGGYFARVYETRYFPVFVVFCALYGLASMIYWVRTYRITRRD